MSYRRLGLCLFSLGALVVSLSATPASAKTIPVIDDSQLSASTTSIGGARTLPTADTIPHFHGTSLNPHDGVTYGWNMAGVDPSTNGSSTSGPSRTATS